MLSFSFKRTWSCSCNTSIKTRRTRNRFNNVSHTPYGQNYVDGRFRKPLVSPLRKAVVCGRLMPWHFTFMCPHTFSHMMHVDKLYCLDSCVSAAGVSWSCSWWPASPSTGASLNHAGLLRAWCRLSRRPLTHLGPYTSEQVTEKCRKSSAVASPHSSHLGWNVFFFLQIYLILILPLWSQSVTSVCV